MNRISVSNIIQATSEVTGIAVLVLLSKSRFREHVRARHMAMYVAREVCGRSYPDIGYRLGGRDHSTALHGVRNIRRRLSEEDLRGDVERITVLAREMAQRPACPSVVDLTGGPEKLDGRFTKTHQPDPEKRRAARMRKPDPMPFPDREPITHTPLPPSRPRASTSSNFWIGGPPFDEERQPRANVGAGNAIGESVA